MGVIQPPPKGPDITDPKTAGGDKNLSGGTEPSLPAKNVWYQTTPRPLQTVLMSAECNY